MKRLKLKNYVLPIIITAGGLLLMVVVIAAATREDNLMEHSYNYVSNTIISRDMAVINEKEKIINPYTDQSVKIGKKYYDYKSTAEEQENSITYHENTYIQNTGVDFVYDKTFDVVSILNGTVSKVKEDEILGKIIEITHDNDYISIYQSLSEINVKKGDVVSQGQVIGKSGTNKFDKDLGNHLHFELYVGGQEVNPTLYLNKDLMN